MFNTPPDMTVLRAVAQLLLAVADQYETPVAGLPTMPTFPPDNGGMPDLSHAPQFVQELLKQMMPQPADGLYGAEDQPMQGDQYDATPDGGHPFVDETTVTPRPFDPHDLPLDKYEDCAEKERQMADLGNDDGRRNQLRDDPLKWMDQAIYYALQMVDDKCDAEDAARSFLCLPGGPTLRVQRASNAQVHNEYDDGWKQANNLIQTAYDSERIDATDFQDCMRRLGEPCNYGTMAGA
jgi:hypothetical protein